MTADGVRVDRTAEGVTVVRAPAYRLRFGPGRPYAVLEDATEARWAELLLDACIDRLDGLDSTLERPQPEVGRADGVCQVTVEARSSAWERRRLVLACHDDRIEAWVEATGSGRITDCRLFGGRRSTSGSPSSGPMMSSAWFSSVVPGEPPLPELVAVPAATPAVVGAYGSSHPGRPTWLFTPGPLCYAFSLSAVPDRLGQLPSGPFLTVGVMAPPGEHTFNTFHYDALQNGFALRLAYEGQTTVERGFRSPRIVLLFGAPDPYAGIERYVATLHATGTLPEPPRARPARWWSEPIFCGWGAQFRLAEERGADPRDLSRQELYDRFLDDLSGHGLVPGTIVIDDRWQATYGENRVDVDRWPDLKGWIGRRHALGQRVLLWFKAWDPEGLPPELCVRNLDGAAVTADPSNPAYEALLRGSVRRMLGADGYDADGLKVDFTGCAPTGSDLVRHGADWGIELLHRLLVIVHEEAKRAKPDALVVAHAPNPYFAGIADAVRLNDILRLERVHPETPVVAHMIHRARIATAACPGLLIDTDDWEHPDRESWRAYLRVKRGLGIPALYFTTRVGLRDEPLEEEDYAALRAVWDAARRTPLA